MFGIKTFFKKHLYYQYLYFLHNRYASKLKYKKEIKVVFFPMNVAMWKYQHLYELMAKNPRFKIYVVLSPSIWYSREQMIEDIIAMREFFASQNIHYIDWKIEEGEEPIDVKVEIDPDILFYTQPYFGGVTKNHDYVNFKKKLLCYYPYAYGIIDAKWVCDLDFHNLLWKFFHVNECCYAYAQKNMALRAKNMIVTGFPDVDDYYHEDGVTVWKNKTKTVKNLIWAPHFTIRQSIKGFAPRSNFLWMSNLMLTIAKENIGRLHIAFKPHPRLKSELYKIADWGKEKTDAYYKQWECMPNSQLETGDFINLFRNSDAMIHDSGSFVMEYAHFYQKPVLFMSQDISVPMSEVNQIGKDVYASCYVGRNEEDIRAFIQNVVIEGNDFMRDKREEVFHHHLELSHGMTVAEATYNNIIQSLGI